MDVKPKRRRRRPNQNKSIEAMARSAMVDAALSARKLATVQRAVQLLEEVRAMLVAEGFEATQLGPMQMVTSPLMQPIDNWRAAQQSPAAIVNPCIECGRAGTWLAPSTKQWFCRHHEELGKMRYADDTRTQTSPTLRVVQTQATAQRAVVQPPPPEMVETVVDSTPALQEKAPPADALREEMDRLMNGGKP